MKITDLLRKDLINLDLKAQNKNDVIDELVEILDNGGVLTNKEEFKKEIFIREGHSSTGLEEGIAIPHAKTYAVKTPSIAFGKSKKGLEYGSLDDEPSKLFFMIAATEGADDMHIETLSKLTTYLLDDDFREALENASTREDFIKIIEKKELEKIDKTTLFKDNDPFVLAVTACPTGIAHTYMSAESLIKAGEKMGIKVKVETNGSIGIKNGLTEKDIKDAKGIIVAADKHVEMDRFDGKKVIECPVKEAIKRPKELISSILEGDAEVYKRSGEKVSSQTTKKTNIKGELYKHLMNGVSFMLPFVVCGGLLIAISLAIGGVPTPDGLQIAPGSFWEKALNIGVAGFKLMIPILAGYIAYSIGDRPALAPAMIGGWIANDGSFYGSTAGAGFIGAILAGLIVGYFVKWVKTWNVPEMLQPIMPILIIPLLGTLFISFIFIQILGAPIAGLMEWLNNFLSSMQTGSAVVLAAILGAMLAFDMGGPINKVAFLFGVASISSGNTEIMGAVGAAGGVPPLAMALATFLGKNKYEEEERNSGKAALVMGFIGISEGAIPFAAKDPFRVLPGIMAGGAIAAAIAIKFGVTNVVPHTGPIVAILGAINKPIPYFMAIIVGTVVGALIVNGLKKTVEN